MTRILIVDDNRNTLKSLEIGLQRSGFSVETATNSAEGLEKLREGHHDILLTDLKMDGFNGVRLAEEAKQFFPELRIIFMSAYRAELSQSDLEKISGYPFFTKPFLFSELLRLLSECVSVGSSPVFVHAETT